MKTISITVFEETVKAIEKQLGLELIGDQAHIKTNVVFEKLKAEGRSKIKIIIVVGK